MVTKWLLDESCRVKRFNHYFSGVSTSVCEICDVCTRSSAYMNRKEILSIEGDRTRIVNMGEGFYNQCKSQCASCKRLDCEKMCDYNRCYKCGSTWHQAKECSLNTHDLHRSYSECNFCYICYRYQEASHHSNGNLTCHIKSSLNKFKNFLLSKVLDGERSLRQVLDYVFRGNSSIYDFYYKIGKLVEEDVV